MQDGVFVQSHPSRWNDGMALQWLFAVVYVAVVCAVAGAIRWGVRRLGVNPSFLACVVIAIALLAYLACLWPKH